MRPPVMELMFRLKTAAASLTLSPSLGAPPSHKRHPPLLHPNLNPPPMHGITKLNPTFCDATDLGFHKI